METALLMCDRRRRRGVLGITLAVVISVSTLCFLVLCPGFRDENPADNEAQTGGTESSATLTDRQLSVEKLDRFNAIVGEWRGVGQPQRGSRRGSWIEAMECRWVFDENGTAAVFDSDENPNFGLLRFQWDTERGLIAVALISTSTGQHDTAVEDQASPDLKLFGTWNEENPDEFTAVSDFSDEDGQTRMRLRQLSEKRLTILLEERRTESGSFRRVTEIGYTRKGESLAVAGASGPECVVTGGRGTIRVRFEDRDYFVCCTGCQQVFEADPAGTIADYLVRRNEARQKR